MPFLLIALLLLTGTVMAEQRPLRFSISDSWAMPMVRIEDGRATGGILYDLQTRLAQKVGRQAEQLVRPRKRVQQMLARGEIDVRCYVNPDWLRESHYQYIWSVPFMMHRDMLVAPTPTQVRPEQLHDEVIGTVLGFSYPRLEPLFASGQLQRDDARTQLLTLSKLSAGRNHYAVSNELALAWYNRQRPSSEPLYAVEQISEDLVACIVRDEPDVPTMALLRALVRMKQDGEFDAILARYR
ncbi:transporter substrate-binding domain-containing protein [Pseudomonas sp. UL073]|uniref:Transporter substrate-binding domain-containing protein n=1 Tax=Zestomonas insulae TaxID=2809017 RepID=A0ABS2IBV3_9GAMM|nr:transporter substrate-binding domain-containing protein [Pseudomonas insulae]MBM7060596.1 transporter substrate-binding domain-containing protein [Pseudomonas insulae]